MTEATQGGTTVVANRGLLTLFVMVSVLMQALDSTIANVALPYMRGSMGASQDQIAWVLTSYIVAAAVMMPSAAWFAARFGRRRVFLVAINGFVLASVLCGLSQTIGQIVAARLVQGVFGACLVPLAQATMVDIYPLESRGRAMALYGMGIMLGPILGPALGGWLTANYSWRFVFYVNVPIGIVAAFGIAAFMPEAKRQRLRFDWTGFALLGLAVASFQAMLDRGQLLDWFGSREILAEAAIAGLSFYCLVVHLALAPQPFISTRLFRDRNFLLGTGCLFVIGLSMYSTLALLSPYLQTLMGYPVLTAGLTMAPSGMGTIVAMFLCGRLVNHVAPRWLALTGFALLACASALMVKFTPDTARIDIVAASLLQGAATGFVFVPLSVVTFSTLAPDLRAEGAGLYSLLRNLGSSIGIAVTSSQLQRGMQINHASLAALVTPFNRALQAGTPATFWNPATRHGAAALSAVIDQQATTIAYADDFKLVMIAALVGAPLALLMGRGRGFSPPGEAVAVLE